MFPTGSRAMVVDDVERSCFADNTPTSDASWTLEATGVRTSTIVGVSPTGYTHSSRNFMGLFTTPSRYLSAVTPSASGWAVSSELTIGWLDIPIALGGMIWWQVEGRKSAGCNCRL